MHTSILLFYLSFYLSIYPRAQCLACKLYMLSINCKSLLKREGFNRKYILKNHCLNLPGTYISIYLSRRPWRWRWTSTTNLPGSIYLSISYLGGPGGGRQAQPNIPDRSIYLSIYLSISLYLQSRRPWRWTSTTKPTGISYLYIYISFQEVLVMDKHNQTYRALLSIYLYRRPWRWTSTTKPTGHIYLSIYIGLIEAFYSTCIVVFHLNALT